MTLTAIYYPKLKRLTYWYLIGESPHQAKAQDVTLWQAKQILRQNTIEHELVQSLEIFKI